MRFSALLLVAALLPASSASGLEPGAAAPPLNLPGIHRTVGPVTLADYKGHVVWLDFWATWCAPCKRSLPEYEQIFASLAPRGFTVIGINVDEQPNKSVSRFLSGMQLTFPLVSDRKLDVARAYGVRTMPTGFLIGPDGVVLHVHTGYRKRDAQRLLALIEQALDARDLARAPGPEH